MAFSSSGLLILLSGGSSNTDPRLSVGGLPSNTRASLGLDGLFFKVSKDEIKNGSVFYRCLYFENQTGVAINNISLWLENGDPLTSKVEIGVLLQDEVQTITIGGSPNGGFFTLTYTGAINGTSFSQTTDNIYWTPYPATTAQNIQNALNELALLGGVTVSVLGQRFTVNFVGVNGSRDHSLLVVEDNHLSGSGVSISTSVITEGSPINAIAPDVGFEDQPPFGIMFSSPTKQSTIDVGPLAPLDLFSIWLKRTVLSGITPDNDAINFVKLNSTISL